MQLSFRHSIIAAVILLCTPASMRSQEALSGAPQIISCRALEVHVSDRAPVIDVVFHKRDRGAGAVVRNSFRRDG